MSFPPRISKRPYDRNPLELNGKGKWQKSGGYTSQLQPLKISPGSTVFRILCPVSKSGSVIGKGGTIITNIRQETGAKVRVEEPISGDDERVIVIVGPEKEVDANNEKRKAGEKDDNAPDEPDETDAIKEDEAEEKNMDNVPSPVFGSQLEMEMPSVQKALFRVFERMVEGEPDDDGDDESKIVVARLLVPSNQIGCILGKGGKIIKQMEAESGAQIRVVPRDLLPRCASTSDDCAQLTGGLEAVRKALTLVSQQLMNNPPRERNSLPAMKALGPSSHPFAALSEPEAHQPSNYQFPAQAGSYPSGPHDQADYHLNPSHSGPNYREAMIASRTRPAADIAFRLLCHNERVGQVIGKGGTIIKTIHHETGCDIKVLEGAPDSEDRIVVISGPVHPDDKISAVQDAVLRVQSRIVRGLSDHIEKMVTSRLLVSSNHIGCLLGKGGSIIAEMRKFSGASIYIVSKDQVPRCVAENEDVVQMTGEFESVQEALLQVTSRLRQHLFPSVNHHLARTGFQETAAPSYPYMGRREVSSPPRMFPSHDERSPFGHRQGGIPPYGSARPLLPPAPWEHQGRGGGGGADMGRPDFGRHSGYRGNQQASMITSTTMEVVVPRAIVPSIYGEDGSSLKQICQISGAEISITDPRSAGAMETKVIISGTPEQTHAAQSLLQAFVLSGASDSNN